MLTSFTPQYVIFFLYFSYITYVSYFSNIDEIYSIPIVVLVGSVTYAIIVKTLQIIHFRGRVIQKKI